MCFPFLSCYTWLIRLDWPIRGSAEKTSVCIWTTDFTCCLLFFFCSFKNIKLHRQCNGYTHKRLCGVRSLCRRFLNQFDTCVNVSPVFFANNFFSSGVGYLNGPHPNNKIKKTYLWWKKNPIWDKCKGFHLYARFSIILCLLLRNIFECCYIQVKIWM